MSDLNEIYAEMSESKKEGALKLTAELTHDAIHRMHDCASFLLDDNTYNDKDAILKLHELTNVAITYLRIYDSLRNQK